MLLDNKSANARLSAKNNLALRFGRGVTEVRDVKVIPIKSPGKKAGSHNVPEFMRTAVAILSRGGENQKTISREFGITQANTSYIESGKTKGIDEEKVAKALDQVRDVALDRLMKSLGLMDEDKLSECSAPALAGIAANMGKVVEKMLPRDQSSSNGAGVQLIIYAPQLKDESKYRTIEV